MREGIDELARNAISGDGRTGSNDMGFADELALGEAASRVRRLAMAELFDVSGKTALVTGGSRGIGLMIARWRASTSP